MEPVTTSIIERGDLAHLALFLWASATTTLLVWTMRELAASNRHFNDFVQQIHQLNQFFKKQE